mgnify:CR=1 FL=1
MIVALLHGIIELEGITSLKEKRRVLNSVKQRMRNTFNVSVAEVDLNNSLGYAELGIALVTNSRSHGEGVMQKVALFLERNVHGRMYDLHTHIEEYGR